ncbi:MAG: ACP S-malonyltransferase [Proteobacteria bacterium]|nr:ACP S-malonyltransferase [Pseudomonadota bacterium]
MTKAMVFPGQGSQSVGMQADLAAEYPVVQQTYAEASDILEYDLWSLVQTGPAEKLAATEITQPAMLTAGTAAFRVWRAAGGAAPDQVAGHSLGEYSALVAAESVTFADAMKVVIRRSQLMQEAVPAGVGAMAAILGLDDAAVIAACAEASVIGIAEPVNFNSPGQVVIAGHNEAIDKAIELAKAAGARRALKLPVSVPSHSSLMIGAGEALQEALAAAVFTTPNIKVVAATDGGTYVDADDIRLRLSKQVYGPVQWVVTINAIIEGGATTIIECGPGKVLAGLCRRINKSIPARFIDSNDSLQKSLQA